MPDRRVLFFNGTCITARVDHGGQISREQSFFADPVGLEAFSDYLRGHRKSLFYLLADVSEEGFQLEAIPYIQGGDRKALIKRRLGQYFYGSPFAVGISLGRGKEGRRDEKMLFAALTRPESLTPWLDLLRAAEVCLVGIYTVPLVLHEQSGALTASRPHCLLITLSSGGLRQTYFADGHMHFSRLSPLTVASPAEVAAACQAESAKTYQYLLGQRLLKRGTTLKTLVLAHADKLDALRSHCHDSDDIQYEFADQHLLTGTKKTLHTPADDYLADSLLAHALVVRTPKRQFAPSAERRLYRLWQTRFAIHATAIAVLFACLVTTGRFASQWQKTREEISVMRASTGNANQQYQGILQGLPKVDLTPDHLRTVISGFGHLQKRSGAYEQLLAHLGASLEAMPSIELQRLEWALAADFTAKLGAGEAAPILAAIASKLPGSSAIAPGHTRNADTAWLIVNIEGQLPAKLANDRRASVELVDRFAADLRRDGVEVMLTKRPIDVESAKSLKSRIESMLGNDTAPHFELRLGRALEP